jgi:tRNA A37 threonylcarbamoyladenosine synthetase subunit TsaC/SUA5/YrdC
MKNLKNELVDALKAAILVAHTSTEDNMQSLSIKVVEKELIQGEEGTVTFEAPQHQQMSAVVETTRSSLLLTSLRTQMRESVVSSHQLQLVAQDVVIESKVEEEFHARLQRHRESQVLKSSVELLHIKFTSCRLPS